MRTKVIIKYLKKCRNIIAILSFALLFSTCSKPVDITLGTATLKDVKWWMYQIQDLEKPGALAALAKTNYEMLVLEPGDDYKDNPLDAASMVKNIHYTISGKKRLLFAYIDIGEAESYRTYWQNSWVAPTVSQVGSPSFLITVDPDGWSDNYPVAYWHAAWKQVWTGAAGRVAKLAKLGFDGVYLDWVGAYEEDKVKVQALKEGVSPEKAMMDFIEEIRNAGKSVNPNFKVIVQNAPYLIDFNEKRYISIIDAVSFEDTWYSGKAEASWFDPLAGDISEKEDALQEPDVLVKQYQKFIRNKIPVFTIDYCINRENADRVYYESQSLGFKPLVTRVSLSKMTETPPLGMN